MSSHTQQQSTFDETRFFARLTGLLAVVTIAMYLRALMAGGFLSVAPITATGMGTGMILAAALVVGSVALLAAWRWEWSGGIVALLCAVAVTVIVAGLVENGALFAAFIYGSPLAIAGSLYLLHAWRRHQA